MIKKISFFKGPNFELSIWGTSICLILSVLIGFSLIYTKLQVTTQQQLVDAYRQANILCDLFAKRASLDQGRCYPESGETPAYNSTEFGDFELLLIFNAAGLIDLDDISLPSDINDASRFPSVAYLARVFKSNPGINQLDATMPTSKLIVVLAGEIGKRSNGESAGIENDFYQDYLAYALANIRLDISEGKPTAYDYLRKQFDGDVKLQDILAGHSVEGRLHFPLSGSVMSSPSAPSDADILNMLLIAKAVARTRVEGENSGWGVQDSEVLNKHASANISAEQRYTIIQDSEKFLLYLISQLHSNEKVSKAREAAVKVRGWEQAGMFILACLILLIILFRFIRRQCENYCLGQLFKQNKAAFLAVQDSDDLANNYRATLANSLANLELKWFMSFIVGRDNALDRIKDVVQAKLRNSVNDMDIENLRAAVNLQDDKLYGSRWVIRWAAITLPALGFIGTVRGILTSLSGADAIVWASTQAERADAISKLSGELGLAFATTFIALLTGILVSLFNDHQTKNEEKFIHELESWAVSALDVNLFKLYEKKSHG